MKKRLFRLSLVLATVLFVFAGCSLLEDDYDEDMIVGSWSCTDGYDYVFQEDHSGARTQAGRTLNFTWSLDGDELEIKFGKYADGTASIVTFKIYIIEELNETRMEVYDQADESKETVVFTKKK